MRIKLKDLLKVVDLNSETVEVYVSRGDYDEEIDFADVHEYNDWIVSDVSTYVYSFDGYDLVGDLDNDAIRLAIEIKKPEGE